MWLETVDRAEAAAISCLYGFPGDVWDHLLRDAPAASADLLDALCGCAVAEVGLSTELRLAAAALLSQFNSTTLGAAPSALWDDVVSCADPLLQQRRLAAHGKQLREATAAFRQGTVN